MSLDLTWGEVLTSFAAAVQKSDKGNRLMESRCRSLFADALPQQWLTQHGLAVTPMNIRMKARAPLGDAEAIIIAPCVRVSLAPGHPKFVEPFSKSNKKVEAARDTVLIQRVDGAWAPAGSRLDASFCDDMRQAEQKLIEIYNIGFFTPAALLAQTAEHIGKENLSKLYQAFLDIEDFTPAYAKHLDLDTLLSIVQSAKARE